MGTARQFQLTVAAFPNVCSLPELFPGEILAAERDQRFSSVVRGQALALMDFHSHGLDLEPEKTLCSIHRPKQIALGTDTSNNGPSRISCDHDQATTWRGALLITHLFVQMMASVSTPEQKGMWLVR
jgi:hypothetical protein